ncbi:MAG TPA: DUF302 domain-containing protein [Vicinamibacteria bacterium]|nr:DUF302 domain-containing protein [Vicinamibacteria bacterium]
MAAFGIRKTLDLGFDAALARVPEALKSEGFGVLTEIDVQATLKKKLDVEFRRYRILGTCNPPFAHQALQHSLDVGMLMPCNVIVYEADDGRTVVSAVDPMQTMAVQGDPALRPLAERVQEKLRRVIDSL